jgi:hypothetical protein
MIVPWGKANWQKREINAEIAHFLIKTLIHLINSQTPVRSPAGAII